MGSFIKLRNKLGMKTPLVEVSMTVTKSNKNTSKRLEKEFRDADMVTFHKYFEASVPGTQHWIYNPNPKKYSKLGYLLKKRNFCFYYDSLMILSNGVVANCCADYEGIYPVGNCNKESIEKIFYKNAATLLKLEMQSV